MNVILQSLQQNVFASTPLCVKSPRFVLQKKNDSVSDASLSWRWQPVYPDATHTDAKKWPRIRRLDAHAYELVHDGKPPKGAGDRPCILNLLADYRHGSLAAYAGAELLFETSLALCGTCIAEGTLSPGDPLFAQGFHGIAWLYVTRGRHDAAEEPFKKALAIREKSLPENHIDRLKPGTASAGFTCIKVADGKQNGCFRSPVSRHKVTKALSHSRRNVLSSRWHGSPRREAPLRRRATHLYDSAFACEEGQGNR